MTNESSDAASTPMESATKVPLEWLKLDRENPRLIDGVAGASDERVIAQLYRRAELNELLQSISTNGYLDIEPLIVMLNPDDGRLIVLEGNRRLAVLRLFREPGLKERIASSEELRIPVPEVEESIRSTFDKVSVYRVSSREEARSFIGFKHINGAAKWDSYAKARFAAEWYKQEKSSGVRLENIAEKIGDRHATVKRMVSAIYVLDQARQKELFDIEDRNTAKFNFSHLYTALSRSQYMDFLGLSTAWSRYDPDPNPVPSEKLDRLRKVLLWIYGSKNDSVLPVVLSQNPDIKRLGDVLANAQGLHVLETTGDLSKAHATTEPADARFTSSLIRARDELRDAAASLRGYDGRDKSLLDIAEDVKETAETIHQRMSKKHREATTDA